ncbi:MAG TPA: GDSL-type esterase/lipase family protein [Azospirillaceae bacterium]|nr:GDSL-type esterase/lipase family protein [Azospirillaceae bacterium]
MRRPVLAFALALALAPAALLPGCREAPAAACPAVAEPGARTTTPKHRSPSSEARHREHLEQLAGGRAGLLLYGDSLVNRWPDAMLARDLGGYRPLNLGIDGDRTQHLLHRLDPAALAGQSPAAAVVLVGTNNVADGDGACAIHQGIAAIVAALRERLPGTPVLLVAIPPRGEDLAWHAEVIDAVNAGSRRLADGRDVLYLDVGDELRCRPAGGCRFYRGDMLHLSDAGYAVLGRRVAEALAARIGPPGATAN